jgi:16S rRNA (guanine527-N7)-methyltransferase
VEHFSCSPMQLLIDGARSLGIFLDSCALNRFSIYLREIKEWNRVFNLTSVKEDRDIIIKHFLDSLTVTPYLINTRRLVDIGSGAGFPGVPLKICLGYLHVVLIDSSLKKVRFLQNLIRCLKLQDICAIHQYVNAQKINLQDNKLLFDTVISRGTLAIENLLTTARRFLSPGGNVIWMYGSRKKSEAALIILPKEILYFYNIQSIQTFHLPFSSHERTITLFKRSAI